jgi:hypothetical protein
MQPDRFLVVSTETCQIYIQIKTFESSFDHVCCSQKYQKTNANVKKLL